MTGSGRDFVLHGTNTLKGLNLEELQWLRLDDDGLIGQITLYIRPAPAAISLMGHIGIELYRRGVLTRAAAATSLAARPLAAVLNLTERYVMPRLSPRERR